MNYVVPGSTRQFVKLIAATCLSLTPALRAAITLEGDVTTNPVSTATDPWNLSNNFFRVGDTGAGKMTIDNGSSVVMTSGAPRIAYIGDDASSNGKVIVDGVNSKWQVDRQFYVGYSGVGELSITNGALVSSNGVYSDPIPTLGLNAGSSGTINVDGAATIFSPLRLVVGGSGSGNLNITNGAKVNFNSPFSTMSIGTGGVVTVEGGGSTLHYLSPTVGTRPIINFTVGGTLNINNGGVVYVASVSTSTTSANVNLDGGTLRLMPTSSTTLSNRIPMALGPGGGKLDIPSSTSTINLITTGITGDGAFEKAGLGKLVLSQNNTYTGDTTISGGTLAISGSGAISTSPAIAVKTGATLDVGAVTGGANFDGTRFSLVNGQTIKGNGTIVGAVGIPAGAILAPGESLGTLNSGHVALTSSDSTFAGEVDAASLQSDLLKVAGTVNLNESTLNLTLANPNAITTSQTYLLIENDGTDLIGGAFNTITGLPAGFSATIDYAFAGTDAAGRSGTGNDLAVTIVPEPVSIGLLGLGAMFLMRRR